MPRKTCLHLTRVRVCALGQDGTQARRHGEQNTSVRGSPQRGTTTSRGRPRQRIGCTLAGMLALVRTRVPAYDRFVDARPQTLDMTQQSIGHLLRLARWHESNNDLESAAAQYAESLHRDADNVQVLLRLGSILHRLGRHDSAVDAFDLLADASRRTAEFMSAMADLP
jgi:cytochrome c-type biogenesis protein CcmH/NrfG